MEVGLRDLAYLLGLVSTALVLWTRLRRGAADVAVWRREIEMKVERLDERLTAHKADHETEAEEAREFRSVMRTKMEDITARLIRIESKTNGGAK